MGPIYLGGKISRINTPRYVCVTVYTCRVTINQTPDHKKPRTLVDLKKPRQSPRPSSELMQLIAIFTQDGSELIRTLTGIADGTIPSTTATRLQAAQYLADKFFEEPMSDRKENSLLSAGQGSDPEVIDALCKKLFASPAPAALPSGDDEV